MPDKADIRTYTYAGPQLKEISFPVGGIGAGCIGLAGNGALVDWEIRNHPDKGVRNDMTHIAVKAEKDGALLDARVLQGDFTGRLSGEYEGSRLEHRGFGYGAARGTMAGFPHFEGCTFHASFPTARVDFEDARFPGALSLHAFSSFAPLQTDDSSLPCAFYEVKFINNTPDAIDYTAAFTLGPLMDGAISSTHTENGVTRFGFSSGQDSLCVATDCADTRVQRAWYRGGWFEEATIYWRDFCRAGWMPDRAYEPAGSEKGTLQARVHVRPGETAVIRFALAWYFPVYTNYWDPPHGDETPESVQWKNWYATQYDAADAVALDALHRWPTLKAQTYAFRDALYASSMPDAALDAAGANLSVLVTPVCLRLTDGSFYGWEGAIQHGGSCEGSCQHVWNYAYAMPLLFPDLERSVRALEAQHSQFPDGRMAFRLKLPPGRAPGWGMPCADGQFGFVMKVYHHYLLTGDKAWLQRMWPAARDAVRFAWTDSDVRWDPERTGILSGRQHHTLDMELFGPNAWLQGFYLGALDAVRRIAEVLGEDAGEYARLYAHGRTYLNAALFNGSYYIQKVDLEDKDVLDQYPGAAQTYWSDEYGELRYQIGEGCLLDQALAQWHMNLLGLNRAYDRDKLRTALLGIYTNNYKPSLRNVFNPCRVFSLQDEAGTLICTYPEGAVMPASPIPYAQETMTGFEYAAAGLMLQEGLRDEGETMIAAVRARYQGHNRNPFNEIECGSNYARSMAAFALTATYAGFTCDMALGAMRFDPLMPDHGAFRGIWFTGAAWGRVTLGEDTFELVVERGALRLSVLEVKGFVPRAATADGQTVAFTVRDGALHFDEEVTVAGRLVLTGTQKRL
ncbi:MAG: hypothetical protein GX810_10530 [Clostridiales bacterium]|nr:hypothetical protein [Clostridiales bacterium]